MAEEAGVPRAWPLAGVAALVEALALAGVVPARPDLLHAVALPPLDLTFDMGALLGRANGAAWFAVGVAASLAGRATVMALMLGLKRWWRFALRFELAVLVPSFVAADLAYTGQAILYSAVFWVGMAIAIVWTLLVAHVPWSRPRSVLSSTGRGLLNGPRLPTVVSYLFAVGVLSVLVRGGGEAVVLVGVAVSTCLTVLTIRRLARPAAAPTATRLGAVVLVGALLGLLVAAPAAERPQPRERKGELVLVAGIDTSTGHGSLYFLKPSSLGFSCADTIYYSYAGTGHGAPRGQAVCPITTGARYTRADTQLPLVALVRAFRAQVDHLASPVTVVAHSSGALIVWASVSSDPATPVRRIVMLAPVTDAHGYPGRGRPGPGSVGAATMRWLIGLARSEGFTRFGPDTALATELLQPANAIPALLDHPLPSGTRALAVPSAYDIALFSSAGRPFELAETACAPFQSHGALATSSQALSDADRFLSGHEQPGCTDFGTWAAEAAAGFQVP